MSVIDQNVSTYFTAKLIGTVTDPCSGLHQGQYRICYDAESDSLTLAGITLSSKEQEILLGYLHVVRDGRTDQGHHLLFTNFLVNGQRYILAGIYSVDPDMSVYQGLLTNESILVESLAAEWVDEWFLLAGHLGRVFSSPTFSVTSMYLQYSYNDEEIYWPIYGTSEEYSPMNPEGVPGWIGNSMYNVIVGVRN